MLRRIIYLTLVLVLLGGLGGGIAFYAFQWKPQFLAQVISSAPKPAETVSAEPARTESWQPHVSAIGTLVAVNGIDITPEVGGVVKEINFESGQRVKKGDKLVQLDTSTEEADLKNFEVQLANAEIEFKRISEVFKKGFSSKQDLDNSTSRRDQLRASVERTKAVIAQKAIFAPWDGQLGLRAISVGKYVAAGQPLIWLQSVDPIYADFTVTEADFGRIKPGQKVTARFDSWPDDTFEGEVFTTDSKIAAESRMITVRASIPNADGRLVPGMYADVSVDVGEPEQVVTVPRTAITYTLYGDSVFVVVEEKNADPAKEKDLVVQRRFVKPGSVREGRVRILEGVQEGDRVVTVGQNKIDQGTKVKIDNSVALVEPENRTSQ
ncbi:MAG: efflux RND transporter periplasmic adaptor subunit [Parvibaculaceae bacterium]